MEERPLGRLFPAGGPADPDMMIGRANDVRDLVARIDQGEHALVAGDRRIGKTTVCRAVCAVLRDQHDFRVLFVEVPERSTSIDLCQLLVDRCLGSETGRRLLGLARPLVEKLLQDEGIPLDLSTLGPEPRPMARRKILELPLRLSAHGPRVVIFFDELQRVAEYDDRDELLHDLTDLYAAQYAAMVLVDGSHQRTIDALLGTTDGLGKLVHRRDLAPTIPREQWRSGLTERFAQAGHPITSDALEQLLDFGSEQPYRTMLTARAAAFTAHDLGGETETFCVQNAITSAQKQLADDGF